MTARLTRSASKAAQAATKAAAASPAALKRQLPTSSAESPPSTPKRSRTAAKGKEKVPDTPYVPPTPNTQQVLEKEAHEAEEVGEREGAVLLHPKPTFDFEDARKHLTSVDARWGKVMASLQCKPFEGEQTEPFNPFRSLVSSILGQQVSWLAARSIQHKFCRLFFPHLPEKAPPPGTPGISPFPTPHQVVDLPDRTASLRSAGLSGRKVEYIVELAERFVDGRLEAKMLWSMNDDELMKTLVECRGIGVWTVHMFLIFSAKRGDVLPVGDLGIQKNLCRWYSHDPSIAPSIHPRKLAPPSPTKLGSTSAGTPKRKMGGNEYAIAALPEGDNEGEGHVLGKLTALGGAEVEQEQVIDLDKSGEGADEAEVDGGEFVFPKTSNNLTPAVLRSRLNGKKLKGNIYLSPQEMEDLTATWAPYRSVACWYLWSLADGTGDP
ncbi:DNA-3-methyladenine glycosylase II [Rhodotorula toruloides]|uniref:DNA-3-methyladenine glycosylase II n=1 Tax=Rhodotorula toruloides TaxID=5286 RepID=A0A511KS83_RHOTO|nr:DNA-3-methyladenine glycosylase II [Rhodotorula toruloides]